MAPFYMLIRNELGLPIDQKLMTEMKEKNDKKIAEIDNEIADAEKNLGFC
jgi:hypothetical protein